jgi:hypothetical protein
VTLLPRCNRATGGGVETVPTKVINWDYYKVVKVMSGEEAFGPITGRCPLAPK